MCGKILILAKIILHLTLAHLDMVIQRIQSVYLLIAAIAMGVFAFVPIAPGSGSMAAGGQGMLPFLSVTALVALLALVTIFQYKRLRLQRTLCGAGALITVSAAAAACIVTSAQGLGVNLACYALPVLATVAFLLARRGVIRDQKLLSSYDRLR